MTASARIANMQQGQGVKDNAPIGVFDGGNVVPITQGAAAEMLNVSRRSVSRAKGVLKEGTPKLIEQVESGEVSVSQAERSLRILGFGTAGRARSFSPPYEGEFYMLYVLPGFQDLGIGRAPARRWPRGGLHAVALLDRQDHLAEKVPVGDQRGGLLHLLKR